MPWRSVDRNTAHRWFGAHDAFDADAAHLVVRPVGYHDVDIRGCDDIRQVCSVRIGRAQHQTPRDPVDLNQRESRRDLIRCPQEDRSAAKAVERHVEGGRRRELRQCDCGITGP